MSSVVARGVVLTAVLAGVGVVGWKVVVEPTPTERCLATAARKLDRLERVVEVQFRRVEHTTTRYDGCDDTGRPTAALVVWVDDWTRRAEGNAFLQQPPWRRGQRGPSATVDGELPVRANVLRSESDGAVRFAIVLHFPS